MKKIIRMQSQNLLIYQKLKKYVKNQKQIFCFITCQKNKAKKNYEANTKFRYFYIRIPI